MKYLKWLLIPMFMLTISVSATVAYSPQVHAEPQSQADCDSSKKQVFLGVVPTWYEYLPSIYDSQTGLCNIDFGQSKKDTTDLTTGKYWLIGLAAIDILVRLAGFIAVIFVIYGGVRYITSAGEPEGTKVARETIINALVGVIIALIAVPVVSYIGGKLGGPGANGVPRGDVSVQDLFDIAYAIIGAIAALMIVIAGFKYIISNGDPQSMGRAKDTILYTIIGVLVVLFAGAIINFVVVHFVT